MGISRTTKAAIRFGYGFHPDQRPPEGPSGLMDQLARGDREALIFPPAGRKARIAQVREMIKLRRANASGDMQKRARRKLRQQAVREGAERLFQRVLSPNGFHERLAAFWCDHFTVAGKNAVHIFTLPLYEPDAIRPHIMGRFEDMLIAAVQHPAMLIYLDQVESFGPNSRAGKRRGRGLNENLAREVLELHTLGVGAGYTQTDVREFAKLLTGFGLHRPSLAFRFFPERAEPGPKTVLGQRYGGGAPRAEDAVELLRRLARAPATADHMARKIAVHFTSDQPEPGLVRRLAETWRTSGGYLPDVYEAMIDHPASWDSFGAKVKQPVDLVVSTLRAMGADQAMVRRMDVKATGRMLGALRALNQPLYRPPGPDGWPEEAEAWITPQGLAGRLDYASKVGQLLARGGGPDPRDFAKAALRDALRPETAFAVRAAPEKWEGIAYALASPEFNRR